MRVRIEFTVPINAQAYAEEVLCDPTASVAEIRDDLKARIENDALTMLSDEGVLMR